MNKFNDMGHHYSERIGKLEEENECLRAVIKGFDPTYFMSTCATCGKKITDEDWFVNQDDNDQHMVCP